MKEILIFILSLLLCLASILFYKYNTKIEEQQMIINRQKQVLESQHILIEKQTQLIFTFEAREVAHNQIIKVLNNEVAKLHGRTLASYIQ